MTHITVRPPSSVTVKQVKLGTIVEDSRFNRRPSRSHIADIASNFNPYCVGTLLVASYGGKMIIIDGLHRLRAMLSLKIQAWFCQVLTGLSDRELYEVFYRFNGHKLKMSKRDLFRFALEAGHTVETAVWNVVVKKHGYTIPLEERDRRRPSAVGSYGSLNLIVSTYGQRMLDKVFTVIRGAFSEINSNNEPVAIMPQTIVHPFLVGLAQFLETLPDKEKLELVVHKLKTFGVTPADVLQEAGTRAFFNGSSGLRGRVVCTKEVLAEIWAAKRASDWKRSAA